MHWCEEGGKHHRSVPVQVMCTESSLVVRVPKLGRSPESHDSSVNGEEEKGVGGYRFGRPAHGEFDRFHQQWQRVLDCQCEC